MNPKNLSKNINFKTDSLDSDALEGGCAAWSWVYNGCLVETYLGY